MLFQDKMHSFTLSQCQYERNMDTCIVEQLYFQTKAKQILSKMRVCIEQVDLSKPPKVQSNSWFGSSSALPDYTPCISESKNEIQIVKDTCQSMV
jgi:hypothetical protein